MVLVRVLLYLQLIVNPVNLSYLSGDCSPIKFESSEVEISFC